MRSHKKKSTGQQSIDQKAFSRSAHSSSSVNRQPTTLDSQLRIKSSLLDSFASEDVTDTVTLLHNMPVVSMPVVSMPVASMPVASGVFPQDNGLPTSAIAVSQNLDEARTRRSMRSQSASSQSASSQLKKVSSNQTSRDAAIKRTMSVIKSDRAKSLPAGSRQLSKLRNFL